MKQSAENDIHIGDLYHYNITSGCYDSIWLIVKVIDNRRKYIVYHKVKIISNLFPESSSLVRSCSWEWFQNKLSKNEMYLISKVAHDNKQHTRW